MRFGQDSIAFLKPEDNGGLTESGGESEGESQGGGEEQMQMVVYDIVDFEKKNATKPKPWLEFVKIHLCYKKVNRKKLKKVLKFRMLVTWIFSSIYIYIYLALSMRSNSLF